MTFTDGLAAPWKGLAWLTRTPSTWGHALVPAALFTLLIAAGSWAGISVVEGWIAPHLAEAATSASRVGLLWYVVRALGWLAALTAAVLLALALAQPLSGPALEAIARKQGADIGAEPLPESPFVAGLLRSLRVTLFGLAATAPLVLGLTFVELVAPPLALLTLPLKVVLTSLMIAWDLLDYPLSLRATGVRTRVAWIAAHFPAVLGLGLSVAAVSLLPCAGLLFLPAGVAGATRLVSLARSSVPS